jgi:hypothetical protein
MNCYVSHKKCLHSLEKNERVCWIDGKLDKGFSEFGHCQQFPLVLGDCTQANKIVDGRFERIYKKRVNVTLPKMEKG